MFFQGKKKKYLIFFIFIMSICRCVFCDDTGLSESIQFLSDDTESVNVNLNNSRFWQDMNKIAENVTVITQET